MATSESDLKEQLADLDWGTQAAPATQETREPDDSGEATRQDLAAQGVVPDTDDGLDSMDVSVQGVSPPRVRGRRGGRQVRRQPVAQSLLDAARDGDTVVHHTPLKRRGRNTTPDVLIQAGESPAVIALFDAMWKDAGSKLARSIGRPKASRQDAAIGWYAMLLAMRERDAKK